MSGRPPGFGPLRVPLAGRPRPTTLPGAGLAGRPTERVDLHDFVEAMRAVAWGEQDFADELAQLRFTIDRVLSIAADLERGLDIGERSHTVTLVSVLTDGATRAARQLAGGTDGGGV